MRRRRHARGARRAECLSAVAAPAMPYYYGDIVPFSRHFITE